MNQLFSDKQLIDSETLQAVKDMRRNGWNMEGIESFFSFRLKITGRVEYIPTLKKQMKIIKRVFKWD